MAQQEYDYYGFISYNRHDRKEAVRLQQQLERYKLPKSLRKEFPDLPERVSPIFLDQSDLVAHDEGLEQALLDQLDRSAYLIVLCSPNSAHSPWVNAEIEHFIGTGRTNHIIPVIISGESHAKDPANECYPPALRDLGGNDKLLSIRIENHGRNGILLRLIATILHLRLDDLIARDAAYRRRKNVIISLAAAVMAAVLAAVIWYITPHSVYYREVVSRWEVPAGIGRVSGEERVYAGVQSSSYTAAGTSKGDSCMPQAEIGLLTQSEDAFLCYRDLVRGKKVASVGHFAYLENRYADLCTLSILEREQQKGDYPDTAAEYLLEEQDYVFITGASLINKTLPRLLELCGTARVILCGPSTVMSGELFAWGVDDLAGFMVEDADACREFICLDSASVFESGKMVRLIREECCG